MDLSQVGHEAMGLMDNVIELFSDQENPRVFTIGIIAEVILDDGSTEWVSQFSDPRRWVQKAALAEAALMLEECDVAVEEE